MAKCEPFGYLLTLDLYDCKPGVCDDIAACYNFLDELVDVLGMKKQSPPFIFKSDDKLYPDKAGLSGWVPLIESGVQIHTLTPKNFISIDVYSCGKFKSTDVKELISRYFQPKEVEENFIERGAKYKENCR